MLLSQAIASAATVGIGCGAGCGSSASAFLTTYVLSEGKNMRYALSQVAAFYIGKMLAVVTVCMAGSLLSRAFIERTGNWRVSLSGSWYPWLWLQPLCGFYGHGQKNAKAVKTAATVPEKAVGFHPLRWVWPMVSPHVLR